ncbi:hypothetical protein SELR_pSRC400400 (plasmid) [Selenomonas ruminantium subsp. lactilytica TAM6421]|uniref:NlpC/P60 family protein n=1 Tax=Selenomonas ruminantium subsp. lactilytica (strain NBRC 103574 / TAM6421) TaxID=927704 RepID=I0GVA4_SELRL|nr:hypothetical protein [Selenomonas ruminantium]BAL84691.1 hypothetical protein SELR_pSRC400400 [Selenomonas ruminantium subsp. lactilytica TAM6421]
MSFDTDKYIGIVHRTNGDTFKECDCVGLARLFYRENGWPETFWDDGEPITHENFNTGATWKRLLRYLNGHMEKTKDINSLRYGACVVFVVNGDMHLGVYVGKGMVLAMAVPVKEGKSTSTLYHKRVWALAFKRGYNRC